MFWQTGFVVVWLSMLDCVAAQGQCYFPPAMQGQLGFQATEQKPCDAFAEVSLCCPLGWTCFSNKLCVVTDSGAVGDLWPLGTALRGTCTNPLWDDDTCGDFCLSNPAQQNNGSLQYCGDSSWCCGPAAQDGSCDCQDKKGTFSVPDGRAQTIIGIAGLESTSTFFTAAFTSTPAKQTSHAISPGTSQTSSISTRASRSSAGAPSTTAKPNIQSKVPLSSSNDPSSTSASSPTAAGAQKSVSITQKTAFKAGIGVVAAITGLAIIVLIVFLFWRRARNQRRAHLPTMINYDDDDSIAPPHFYPPPPMFAHDADPYVGGGNIPIPPRSPARGSPVRGSPTRGPLLGGAAGGYGPSQLREVRGVERTGRSPSPSPSPSSVEDSYIPYRGM